jgi:phosphatidylglycerol:prolipoprotein diacylglycerol transferase
MNPLLISALPVIQPESWQLLSGRIWILASGAVFTMYMVSGIRRKIPLSQLLLGAAIFFLFFTMGSALAVMTSGEWHQLFIHGEAPMAGNKSILGGLAGMLAACLLVGAWTREGGWIADMMAIALPVGACIQRIACLLAGCCAGTPTSLPWGIRYGRHADVWLSQVNSGQITAADPCSLPVHPTQVYDILGWVLVLFTAIWAARHFRSPGNRLLLTLLFYGIFRFFLEFMRDPVDDLLAGSFLWIRSVQWMILAGLSLPALIIVLKEWRAGRASHQEVPEEVAFARQLIMTLFVVTIFLLTWRLFYLPGLLAMTLLLGLLFIVTAARVFRNTHFPRSGYALWLSGFAVLIVVSVSCTKSRFATTTRQYRNGKAVYTNHYANERRSFIRTKVTPAPRKEAGAAVNPLDRRSPATASNLLASTDNGMIFSGNENDLIPRGSGAAEQVDLNITAASPLHTIQLANHPAKVPGKEVRSDTTVGKKKNGKEKQADPGQASAPRTEKLGLAGFILSFFGLFPLFGIPFAILALIFGTRSLKRIKSNPEKYKGKEFANASVLIGCIGILVSIIFLVVSISTAATEVHRSNTTCKV